MKLNLRLAKWPSGHWPQSTEPASITPIKAFSNASFFIVNICSVHVMIDTLVYDKVYLISFFYLTLENFWNCLDLMRKNVKSFRNPKWYDRQHLDSWTCQIRVRLQLDKKESYKILSISISYMRARIEVTWVMEYIFCWRIIYGFFLKKPMKQVWGVSSVPFRVGFH